VDKFTIPAGYYAVTEGSIHKGDIIIVQSKLTPNVTFKHVIAVNGGTCIVEEITRDY